MLNVKKLLVLWLVIFLAGCPVGVFAQDETPFPTATPAPPLQKPLIFVRSSWVEPAQVAPGALCRLYLELHNMGNADATKIVISISGANFVPELSSSVKLVERLHPNEHGTVWQELRSTPALEGGSYPITVAIAYEDDFGRTYDSTEVVGIKVLAVPTRTPAPKAGRPQLVIESFTTDPARPTAGQVFTLTLTLHNSGTGGAHNILLTNGVPSAFAPVGSGNVVSVNNIGWQETVQVAFQLVADQTAKAGPNLHPITLEWDNWGGEHYDKAQNVAIPLEQGASAPVAAEPLVVIQSYRLEPEILTPGQPFTLTLTVTNVGSAPAGRVTLTLGGQSDAAKNASFAPVGTGNVKYLAAVAPDAVTDVVTRFIVDGAATAGVYVMTVGFEYFGSAEKSLTRSEQISLVVKVRPQLLFNFYRAVDTAMVGQRISLPIEILNTGRGRVNSSEVEIVSDDLKIETPRTYIGPLDAGGSTTLDGAAVAESAGEKRFTVRVFYTDDFNEPQVFESEKVIQVADGGGPLGPGEPGGAAGPEVEQAPPQRPWLLRLLLGLFGLGSA